MFRLLVGAFALVVASSAVPLHAAPADGVSSRYERDILQAQKRLIKHRNAKAKALLKRQRAKAERISNR